MEQEQLAKIKAAQREGWPRLDQWLNSFRTPTQQPSKLSVRNLGTRWALFLRQPDSPALS